MSKKESVGELIIQIDDQVLKSLLDKISSLSSQVSVLQSQVMQLESRVPAVNFSHKPDAYAK